MKTDPETEISHHSKPLNNCTVRGTFQQRQSNSAAITGAVEMVLMGEHLMAALEGVEEKNVVPKGRL